MSKELEALKEIKASHLQAHIDSKNIGTFDIWFDEYYETIKQALTPPTADEVCKALQEDCKIEKVIYDNGRFYDEDDGETLVSQFKMDGIVHLDLHDFIFNIETLGKIVRFYEGLEAQQ